MPDTHSPKDVYAMASRLLTLPAYTAADLGFHRLRQHRSDIIAPTAILINEEHRLLVAAALLAFGASLENT